MRQGLHGAHQLVEVAVIARRQVAHLEVLGHGQTENVFTKAIEKRNESLGIRRRHIAERQRDQEDFRQPWSATHPGRKIEPKTAHPLAIDSDEAEIAEGDIVDDPGNHLFHLEPDVAKDAGSGEAAAFLGPGGNARYRMNRPFDKPHHLLFAAQTRPQMKQVCPEGSFC